MTSRPSTATPFLAALGIALVPQAGLMLKDLLPRSTAFMGTVFECRCWQHSNCNASGPSGD